MRPLRSALARIAGVFRGAASDDDVRAEFEAHVEMETAENVRRGVPPAEARRQALLASGGLAVAAEAVRDQRGLPWLESSVSDIKFAFRAIRHSRAFSAVVIVTLALGIGANTAIFSVVRGVLLKPLPHRDGDRLVYLRHSADGPSSQNLSFSVPEVEHFRNGVPSLGGIAQYSSWFGTLQEDGDATRLTMGLVTGNYFDVMGLAPVLGRLTSVNDDGPGAARVMVLTHEFWMKAFAGDRAIVGRQLRLDGSEVTVIGVLQPAPFFPDRMDVLCNMVVSPHHLSAAMVQDRVHRMTEVVARLAPDATMERARAEVAAVFARMQIEHTQAYDPVSHPQVSVILFKEALGERARLTLWLLMGAASFVLVISAANVANLTLMRGVRREHELVVRAALGAGSRRLRRLLLAENLMLALFGAALGLVLAVAGTGVLTAFAARYSARASEIRLDGAVLGFALGLSAAVALLLSFVATIPQERTLASISAGARRLTSSARKQRLQRALVVTQVAVSVVLLAGASLLTRTMLRLSEVSTGLGTEEVLTLPVPLLNPSRISPAADVESKQLYEKMREEVRALPGVGEVGVGSTMPLRTSLLDLDFKVEGKPLSTGEAVPHADLRTADPTYFRAASIPLLAGREFSIADGPGAAKVAIVNQVLADKFFPGQDPLGQRVAWTGDVLKFTPFSGEWRTIVGVVGATRDGGLDTAPREVVFMPFAQEFAVSGGLVIRAARDVAGLRVAVERIVRRIVPGVPLENVLTVAQIKDQSVSPRRLNAALISAFGVLALIIAAVGIGGVLAFSVSARTNEIGVRMSLGAQRGRVQRMIMGEGGVLLATGLMLGMIGAYFAGGLMRSLLFGVTPDDPMTLASVALLMTGVGCAACWIPAWRASRIDPVQAMRAP